MEITLETIYQQLLDTEARLKAELKAEMAIDKAELKAEVASVKTWFIGLSLSTILVVTAIMTTFLNMQ